jgi:hypothetical protein
MLSTCKVHINTRAAVSLENSSESLFTALDCVAVVLSSSWYICKVSQFLGTGCGYEVSGMMLLQALYLYTYTYTFLRGVTFKVLPLSRYALGSTTLPLLETFLDLLLNIFQCCRQMFLDVFNILKSPCL